MRSNFPHHHYPLPPNTFCISTPPPAASSACRMADGSAPTAAATSKLAPRSQTATQATHHIPSIKHDGYERCHFRYSCSTKEVVARVTRYHIGFDSSLASVSRTDRIVLSIIESVPLYSAIPERIEDTFTDEKSVSRYSSAPVSAPVWRTYQLGESIVLCVHRNI